MRDCLVSNDRLFNCLVQYVFSCVVVTSPYLIVKSRISKTMNHFNNIEYFLYLLEVMLILEIRKPWQRFIGRSPVQTKHISKYILCIPSPEINERNNSIYISFLKCLKMKPLTKKFETN